MSPETVIRPTFLAHSALLRFAFPPNKQLPRSATGWVVPAVRPIYLTNKTRSENR
jgi:hypothetical protein